jgi:hypothetical protein
MARKLSRATANSDWYYLIVKYYDGRVDCFKFTKPRIRASAHAKLKREKEVKSIIFSEKPV